VLTWAKTVFKDTEKEMIGLEWGRLYEKFHNQPYNSDAIGEKIKRLYGDPYVKDRKGIWEYVLGGEQEADRRLLDVRLFDEATKRKVYDKQTKAAEAAGVSNCSICKTGHAANASKIYKINEMEADHVTAWSNGGSTSEANCEMLCTTHNRAKGNR
jgi:5-methylcytosine-specific restriction endonuclease McrA